MPNVPRFTPFISTKPVEGQTRKIQQDTQNVKAQDAQETTRASNEAMKFQPQARATQSKLLGALKESRKKPVRQDLPHTEDLVAQAATAGTFNPFIENALKDSTVIGFGGLTYGEERKLFPGIYVGMKKSPEELLTAAHQFMLDHFVPSHSVGF